MGEGGAFVKKKKKKLKHFVIVSDNSVHLWKGALYVLFIKAFMSSDILNSKDEFQSLFVS